MPSEDAAECSVSEMQQPLQSAGRTEPVPRLSRLLSLSLSVIRSLSSPNRAVDPSWLEVTTGHRLNQSKPRFISLLPTRILSSLLFSPLSPLFSSPPPLSLPFLTPRIFRSYLCLSFLPGSLPPSFSFHLDSLLFLSLPGLDHPPAAMSRDSRRSKVNEDR